MTKMKITIAICTWNRCRLLDRTLRSLCQMELSPERDWQVVLVDNNSSDETKEVADRYSSSLPLVYVFESVQGHSQSRNAAIQHAKGDMIIWTDNDVLVAPDWLENYARAAERYSEFDFFGGGIHPVFESGKPGWLESTWEKCRPVFAYRDLGNKDFELKEGQFPYGANMAIRTEVQKKFPFTLDTGRKAESLLGGDEISMLRKVAANGHRGMWLGNVGVEHTIPPDRATERYVQDYFFGQGQANVQDGRAKFKSRLQATLAAKFNGWCYRNKRSKREPDEWVSHMVRSSIAAGELHQMNRLRAGD